MSGVEIVEYAVIYTAIKFCASPQAAEVQRDCIAKSQRREGIPSDARIVRRTAHLTEWETE